MIGDKIEIKPAYLKIATKIVEHIFKQSAVAKPPKYVIAIAGESGSGKSVTALCLQHVLQQRTIQAVVFHQDDYFKLPPAQNHAARLLDIKNVGIQEVDLILMQQHIQQFLQQQTVIAKPLIHYNESQRSIENIDVQSAQVLIVEGTYALYLTDTLHKIFMSRTYLDTVKQRQDRAREPHSDFIESVLAIEHQIIKTQKNVADLLVLKDYSLQTIL
jgi:uridine kinase